MIITIDGPAGSGKSTVARLVAQQLGLYYIASGALYRAVSYCLLEYCGYSLKSIENPRETDLEEILNTGRLKYIYNNISGEKITFDDHDVTPFLKSELVSSAASIMALDAQVHKQLIAFQRMLAHERDVIIDGRNCGSEVFPHAEVKIYLTATVEIRAQRMLKNDDHDLAAMIHILNERDKRDAQRTVAPLMIPQGAIIIDNSDLTIKQTVTKMIEVIHRL